MPHEAPTKKPLTDPQVKTLGQEGFKEGDFVPGKGILTPTGTFRDPLAGESGFQGPTLEDISAGLEKAKTTALEIQRQAAALAKDQETGAETDGIVSTDTVVQGERDLVADIKSLQDPGSPFEARRTSANEALDIFEQRAEALEKRREAEVARIEAASEAAIAGTEEAQKREKGTFQVGLARIGGFLGESASSMGAILNLNAEHRAEIATLESKRDSAILAANNAIDDKQFAVAKAQVAEIRSLEEEIDKRRNTFFDQTLDLIKEQRLSQVDPFFTSASVVSLMKDIPIGERLVLTDPATGRDLEIIGIRTDNPNVKTIQTTDEQGEVRVTSYAVGPNGELFLIEQESIGNVGKGQQVPFSIQLPRQSRQAIFDSSGLQVGWQTWNPITNETGNFDLNGNDIEFPEGGRLGTFGQEFDGAGLSNADLAGG